MCWRRAGISSIVVVGRKKVGHEDGRLPRSSHEKVLTRKTFRIGLNKTGITRLGTYLTQLGYNHVSVRADLLAEWKSGGKDAVFAVTDAHESFEDWPWPLMYCELFERYGGDAKFILTLRWAPEAWLESLKNNSLRRTSLWVHCRKMAYGYNYPHYAEVEHLEIYRRHAAAVEVFFTEARAREQLAILCWEKGDGWNELCDFLGRPRVDFRFPDERRAATTRLSRRRVAMMLGKAARGAGTLFRNG
jgi:hypothetical protein